MSSFSKILRVCNYFLVILIGLSSLQCQKEPVIDQDLFIVHTPPNASNDTEKKYGFINNKGEVIIEPQYDSVTTFSEGLAWVKVGDKYGCIDKSGEMVIEPLKCEQAQNFSEGLAAISIEGKWGYIDKEGDLVIPPKFKSAYQFSEGLAPVSLDAKKGYFNKDWHMVLPHYGEEGKLGYINKSGEMVIPPKFSGAGFFKENFAVVRMGKYDLNMFLIDKNGKTYFENQSYRYGPLSEGMRAVRIENKWGFMNNKCEMVIEPRYRDVGNFSEGLAAFQHKTGTGFINKNGKVVIKQEFLFRDSEYDTPPPSFSEGLARIFTFTDYKTYFIDTTGRKVFQSWANSFSEGLALKGVYNRYGYIDTTGRLAIEPKFDIASDFKKGLAAVSIGGINAYINKSGEYIWPPDFHDVERILDRSTPRSVAELYAESIIKGDFRLFNRISADSTDIKYLTNKFGKGSQIVKEAKRNYNDLTRQFSEAGFRIYDFYREATNSYEGNLGIPENLEYHLEERDIEEEDWGVVYEFNFVLDEVLKSKVIRIYMAKDSNNKLKCFKDNLNY